MVGMRAAIVTAVVVAGTLAVGVALASALGWAQAPADTDIPPIASSRAVEQAFDTSAPQTETGPATVQPDDDDADDDREVVRPPVRDSDDDERDEAEEDHEVEVEAEVEAETDEAHEVEAEVEEVQ